MKVKHLSINETFQLQGDDRLYIRIPEMGLNSIDSEFLVNALTSIPQDDNLACARWEALFVNPELEVF